MRSKKTRSSSISWSTLKANANGGVAPAVNRTAATMEAIEQIILDRKLQPGDTLPTEATLSDALGVSRSAVREAFSKLQALDIVEIRHGRGTVVGNMSMRPLVQTIMLRSALDPESLQTLSQVVALRQTLDKGIARDLVNYMQGEPDDELHSLVDDMVEKAEKGRRFLDEDMEFHAALYQRVGNVLLEQLAEALWLIHMRAMTALPAADVGYENLLRTAQAHRLILTAVEAGDVDAYYEAIGQHYAPLQEGMSSAEGAGGASSEEGKAEGDE